MHAQTINTTHGDTLLDVKWDHNGQRLATASSDATVKIIGLGQNSALHPLATLTCHQGPVRQLTWGPPKFGSFLASCSWEGRVVIWKEENPIEWKEVYVSNEHQNSSVNCILWAPHELGLCLACGFSDGSILVLTARSDVSWDADLIHQAHPGGVTCVSWAPAIADKHSLVHKLASGGRDNAMKVWKLCNGTWKMDCCPEEVRMDSDSKRDGLPSTTIPSILDPPNVTPGEGKLNRWQLEEDELLIRTWLDGYKDPNAANDQKMLTFWNWVSKRFEENRRGGAIRTGAVLKKRWHRINVPVKKFVDCYGQACQQCESETDEKDIIAIAHKLYSSQNDGCRFNLVHAWMFLKDEPKWKAYVNLLSCEDYARKSEVSESGACKSESNTDTMKRGIDSSKVDLPDDVRKTTSRTPDRGISKLTKPSTSEGDASPGEGRNRWQQEEDEVLVRAWLYVSKHPILGNDPRMVPFWDRVSKHFDDTRKGGIFRSCAQLKKRWHRVSKIVKKFVECYDQAYRQCQSKADNEDDVLGAVHRIYRFENDDCRFNLEHAWILLKDEPKWRAYVNLPSYESCSKRMKISECEVHVNNDENNNSECGSHFYGVTSEVCDIKPMVKPLETKVDSNGLGKSKGVLMKELGAIKSAELKKANALEELARTKQMEVDMQIIYKDTSSMNSEQLQFHVHLVEHLKQKYLL